MLPTLDSLRKLFDCGEDTAERLLDVARAGLRHGRAGWYREGDYSSDADWCYGVGAEIARLEETLAVYDSSVFDVYTEAHAEGLTEYDRSLVTMVFDGHNIGYRLASGASELDADCLAEVIDDVARATFARLASDAPQGSIVTLYLDAWERACARGVGPLANADASGIHWVASERDFS